ncbi:MAG: universal stress protein [Flavobacteriales bacterium]|nr:universal stress protein [Flavobacteriales bacterium]
MNKLNYLVPHDFTEVGDTALDYASNLAIRSQAEVYLVHIVKKETHKDEAKEKLIEIIQRKKNEMPKLKLGGSVKTGNIFEDIASTAAKVESNLVIMGTHGAKGMQKVLGSFAMKVVTSTNLPFLIIQSGVSMNRVERIVFPVDVDVESVQIMNVATYMARLFQAEVHLIAPTQTDNMLSRRIINNMKVVAKQLKKNEIEYVTKLIAGGGSFSSKTMEYAKTVDGNMIALSINNEGQIISLNKFAQGVITNEDKIPALIVNSISVTSTYF